MNKIKLYIVILMSLFVGCCDDCDSKLYTTSATIFLINETDVIVKSGSTFGYEILPGETLTHRESFTNEYSDKPTVETYDPFPTAYLFYYGDGLKCESGLRFLENYENFKEIEPLIFELTFRFTEEKKIRAENCN
jgi:hypothetical protein